ncbi:MAG: FAD-dependent oxidoreductase [Candidatus Levybacteria bacterium]|nr:FAD-dependent oxidoreductase [Candidatus Levybacteria bacterium]
MSEQTYIFIAGGIGITPFRSMVKDLVDKKKKIAITLFYQAHDESELLFGDLFAEAKETIGLQTVYLLQKPPKDWPFPTGHVTQELLEKYVPHYLSSLYYVSGPQSMVTSYNAFLESLFIPSEHIKTDLFTGYA